VVLAVQIKVARRQIQALDRLLSIPDDACPHSRGRNGEWLPDGEGGWVDATTQKGAWTCLDCGERSDLARKGE
jgi:hypothetical protein